MSWKTPRHAHAIKKKILPNWSLLYDRADLRTVREHHLAIHGQDDTPAVRIPRH